jgi:hypothetical protein
LDFTLSSGQKSGTLLTSSGQEITVNGGGSFALGGSVSTGWGLNNNVAGGLQLDALGFVGPSHLIIGPPGGPTYANANGSIAGNGPHNPFLNQTASFTLSIPGLTADSRVTSATFSFGTTAGINVPGVPPGNSVPDGGTTALLLGAVLSGFGLMRKRS